MKHCYFAMETINRKTGKYCPMVCPVCYEYESVINKLNCFVGDREIVTVMVCQTEKKALEVVELWRESHDKAGRLDKFTD